MASAGTAPAQASERIAQENQQIAVSKMVAAARMQAGAKWFYWIAGLSMINSLMVMSGTNLHFVIGLGVTSVVDGLAKHVGAAGSVLDIVINGCVAALFVLLGTFAVKAQKWAFLIGMVLYALDGVLCLGAKDFLSVAFHAYALFAIYRGFGAAQQVQP
jgi:hypothetical protein